MNKDLTKRRQQRKKLEERFKKEKSKIDDEQIANIKHIGRCFRCKNKYSEGNEWWVYRKIIGVHNDSFVVETFQKDCYGKIEIETPENISIEINENGQFTDSDLQEITPNEYQEIKEKFLDELKCTDMKF